MNTCDKDKRVSHIHVAEVKPMPKKKGFHIRYHKVEGDLRGVIKELVQEKVKSAMSTQGYLIYNDINHLIDNFVIGENVNAENRNICSG